jgi:hypothetical protein
MRLLVQNEFCPEFVTRSIFPYLYVGIGLPSTKPATYRKPYTLDREGGTGKLAVPLVHLIFSFFIN